MTIRRLVQPEGSAMCGQTCVAMAAGVSLDRAIKAVGHDRATTTKDVSRALQSLGIPCDTKCRRVKRVRPVYPKRCMVVIHRPKEEGRRDRWHWMLMWDGEVYDPGGAWPDRYANWKITSYLEIFS